MGDFALATPESSGVVRSHLSSIHSVCQNLNSFMFLRPSTVPTMRLIEAGFATKSMDVHDKSSDWGLTSGLVPCDQAFSKAWAGKTPNPHPDFHKHGQAEPIHLNLSSSFETLFAKRHFDPLREIKSDGEFRYFKCDNRPTSDITFALALKAVGKFKSGDVFWCRDSAINPKIPVYVWGYKSVPVTGDYDMWMVAPYHKNINGDLAINSNKDAHGRSAASAFSIKMIRELNLRCRRVDKPVFNHGAEAQNVSFTQQMDRYLVLFCPGRQAPIMVPRLVVGAVLHDLLLRGYLAIRNPKWVSGSTLGIEDMADAHSEFPNDPMVQAGKQAREKLEKMAALRILQAWRDRPAQLGQVPSNPAPRLDTSGWAERYKQLRHFRVIARASEMDDVTHCVILPNDAFPRWGAGSSADMREQARQMSREAETNFGRTGFTSEGGSVSPIDESRNSNANVRNLRNFWEQQKL